MNFFEQNEEIDVIRMMDILLQQTVDLEESHEHGMFYDTFINYTANIYRETNVSILNFSQSNEF